MKTRNNKTKVSVNLKDKNIILLKIHPRKNKSVEMQLDRKTFIELDLPHKYKYLKSEFNKQIFDNDILSAIPPESFCYWNIELERYVKVICLKLSK